MPAAAAPPADPGQPLIDTKFDFRTDTPAGLDPDTKSPRLRRYHQLLWSKPLPRGAVFELSDVHAYACLHHSLCAR